MPAILDRLYWDQWEQIGRPSIDKKVKERLEELLASYKPHPLDDSIERDVKKVLKKARSTLGGVS